MNIETNIPAGGAEGLARLDQGSGSGGSWEQGPDWGWEGQVRWEQRPD